MKDGQSYAHVPHHHYALSDSAVYVHDTGEVVTTLQARRVINRSEELQISVEIVKRGEKRNTISHGYLTLRPEDADALAQTILTLKAKSAE